jgi:hypothetical protein
VIEAVGVAVVVLAVLVAVHTLTVALVLAPQVKDMLAVTQTGRLTLVLVVVELALLEETAQITTKAETAE